MAEDQKPHIDIHDPDWACRVISVGPVMGATNRFRWRRRPGEIGQVLEQAWQDMRSGQLSWIEVETVEEA